MGKAVIGRVLRTLEEEGGIRRVEDIYTVPEEQLKQTTLVLLSRDCVLV